MFTEQNLLINIAMMYYKFHQNRKIPTPIRLPQERIRDLIVEQSAHHQINFNISVYISTREYKVCMGEMSHCFEPKYGHEGSRCPSQ